MAYLQEYEKLCMLGKGAFATIWKVRHNTLGYIRAIKVSKEDIDNENDKAYQTFLKECRVLLKIGNGAHPNIVRIYQPRLIDNRALVEMDYVRGCTLNEYLEQHKFMPIAEVMRLIKEIGGALAYCHHDIYEDQLNPVEDHLKCDPDDAKRYAINDAKREELIKKYRIIHNDLHSNNIMRRDYDGGFILLDFGLAIQNDRAVKSSSRQDGALEYKAPEKWEDECAITTQSDIYSLGILIYEALAGHVPFVFDPDKYSSDLHAKNEMFKKHRDVTPPAIEPERMASFKLANPGQVWEKDYPDWLEKMVMKCLEKNPADRYADARELIDDFNRNVKAENSTKVMSDEKVRYDTDNERLRKQVSELTDQQNKTTNKPIDKNKTKRGLWLAVIGTLLVLAVGAAMVVTYEKGFDDGVSFGKYVVEAVEPEVEEAAPEEAVAVAADAAKEAAEDAVAVAEDAAKDAVDEVKSAVDGAEPAAEAAK